MLLANHLSKALVSTSSLILLGRPAFAVPTGASPLLSTDYNKELSIISVGSPGEELTHDSHALQARFDFHTTWDLAYAGASGFVAAVGIATVKDDCIAYSDDKEDYNLFKCVVFSVGAGLGVINFAIKASPYLGAAAIGGQAVVAQLRSVR